MNKICTICKTEQSKKWYKHENEYICQKDYRHLRYNARKEEIKSYQKEYYKNNLAYIKKRNSENYHAKTLNKLKNDSRCHQKIIRDSMLESDLKRIGKKILELSLDEYTLQIENFNNEHRDFIEVYEWLGHVGNTPKWTFTARCKGHLAGVVLLNEPNCYSKKLLNIDTTNIECLIQRGACASWSHKHLGSKLIRFACNWMVNNTQKRIFVAYSDPCANEIGTIYQACGFDYLGNSFGSRYAYKHISYKRGKFFTAQSLRRTSSLRKFLTSQNILWDKSWEKENGFKDLSKLPDFIKSMWYAWIKDILKQSKKISLQKKGKYILVLGKNRREQRLLNTLKIYKIFPYPKRSL